MVVLNFKSIFGQKEISMINAKEVHRRMDQAEKKIPETATGKYRHNYHLMPPTGWLNDPNGLSYYGGNYHVFFQYAPEDARGSDKCWGHYQSPDLLNWEYTGIAIYPDTEYDRNGAYSGGALTDDGSLELFYTGNIKEEGNFDYINEGRGATVIYLSTEDGVHLTEKELLMTNDDYPADLSRHVRDPKVWKDQGSYYMLLGARTRGSLGEALLYRSEDKKAWRFLKTITATEAFGYMWECPDYFQVDGRPVFAFSPQGIEAEEYRFENTYQSGYLADVKLPETGQIRDIYQKFREWDLGFDFYAPQTFEAPDGRRILFGWAGVTDSPYDNEPSIQEGWQYSMTVPRELSWKGDILCQNPARELEALRKEEVAFGNGEAEIDGGAFDLVAERGEVGDEACATDKTGAEPTGKLETSDKKETCGDIPVRICLNEDLQITYEQGVVSMEFLNNTGSGRTIRKAKLDSFQNVRILMDVSLVEVYFNDGELVMTTRYYPEDPAKTKVSISGMEQVKCWKN